MTIRSEVADGAAVKAAAPVQRCAVCRTGIWPDAELLDRKGRVVCPDCLWNGEHPRGDAGKENTMKKEVKTKTDQKVEATIADMDALRYFKAPDGTKVCATFRFYRARTWAGWGRWIIQGPYAFHTYRSMGGSMMTVDYQTFDSGTEAVAAFRFIMMGYRRAYRDAVRARQAVR
jgi:hypothetical protein